MPEISRFLGVVIFMQGMGLCFTFCISAWNIKRNVLHRACGWKLTDMAHASPQIMKVLSPVGSPSPSAPSLRSPPQAGEGEHEALRDFHGNDTASVGCKTSQIMGFVKIGLTK